MHSHWRKIVAYIIPISLLMSPVASAQNFGAPTEQLQPPPPASSSDDNFAADLLECGLLLALLVFDTGSNGSGSGQSGYDEAYQHRLNQYGGSSSETPPEPDNSTGLYGTCHNPMGC